MAPRPQLRCVVRRVWSNYVANAVLWKSLSALLVCTFNFGLVLVDLVIDLDRLVEEYGSANGVKGACLALGSATLAFLAHSSNSAGQQVKALDNGLRAAAACFALLSGFHWLLAETGDQISLFTLLVVPSGIVLLGIALVYSSLVSGTWKLLNNVLRVLTTRRSGTDE